MILLSTRIGFIDIPPYNPECRSLSGPIISSSIWAIPLNIVTIAGVSELYNPVSQIKAKSDFSSALLACIKGTREGEPVSSSPSKKTDTLIGK